MAAPGVGWPVGAGTGAGAGAGLVMLTELVIYGILLTIWGYSVYQFVRSYKTCMVPHLRSQKMIFKNFLSALKWPARPPRVFSEWLIPEPGETYIPPLPADTRVTSD